LEEPVLTGHIREHVVFSVNNRRPKGTQKSGFLQEAYFAKKKEFIHISRTRIIGLIAA